MDLIADLRGGQIQLNLGCARRRPGQEDNFDPIDKDAQLTTRSTSHDCDIIASVTLLGRDFDTTTTRPNSKLPK